MTTPYSMYVCFGDELGGGVIGDEYRGMRVCVRACARVPRCVCVGGGGEDEYYLFYLVRHFSICGWVKPVQNRG